jgi:hypothetical protein
MLWGQGSHLTWQTFLICIIYITFPAHHTFHYLVTPSIFGEEQIYSVKILITQFSKPFCHLVRYHYYDGDQSS